MFIKLELKFLQLAALTSIEFLFIYQKNHPQTQKAIQDYRFLAFESLQKISIDNEKKEILRSFGENLMGRKV